MTVRIQYHDNTYDIIPAFILDRLIISGRVKAFYRYSERRWVSIDIDPIRGKHGLAGFVGSDRRVSDVPQPVA